MRDILGTSLIENYNIIITSTGVILFLHQETIVIILRRINYIKQLYQYLIKDKTTNLVVYNYCYNIVIKKVLDKVVR